MQDEHAFGHPAVTLCHRRGDTQGEATSLPSRALPPFEPKDQISLVSGRVMYFPSLQGQFGVFLTGREGSADGVTAGTHTRPSMRSMAAAPMRVMMRMLTTT